MNNPQKMPPIGKTIKENTMVSLNGVLPIKCRTPEKAIAVSSPQPITPYFKTYDHLPFLIIFFSFSSCRWLIVIPWLLLAVFFLLAFKLLKLMVLKEYVTNK